jgi:hypothetical protein
MQVSGKISKKDQARRDRTQKLIDNFRGKPGEFYMLKGILCADHGFDSVADPAYKKINLMFDMVMIAARMDNINSGAA